MSRIKRRRMWRTSRAKIARDIKKLARNSCCRIANRTTTQKRSSKLTGTFTLTLILKELSEFREKISNEPAKAVRQSNKLYPTPNISMDNFFYFFRCVWTISLNFWIFYLDKNVREGLKVCIKKHIYPLTQFSSQFEINCLFFCTDEC